MKSVVVLFLLFLFTSSTWGQSKITLKEAITKCNALEASQRVVNPLCQKVDARLKELAKQKASGSHEKIKQEKIKQKCEQLGNEKMMKYRGCREYLFLDPDPLLGKEQSAPARYQFNLGYSFLSHVQGFEFEAKRRSNHFAFGLFYSGQNISDLNENKVKGSAYGVSFNYHFLPLSYTKDNLDLSFFSHLGMTSYQSEAQSKLPSYIYANIGMELAYPVSQSFSVYGKIGTVNIYHSESNLLNLGAMGTLGVSFGF